MKISVSVCGRFHAFNLAQQLLKKDLLCQLTTSYPKFEVAKYGIPKYLVNSIFVKEILERSWSNLPVFIRKLFKPHYFILQTYDLLASLYLKQTDICVAFSGCAYHTIKKAKRKGAVTVLERGSSHMLYQTKILKEEYERLGLTLSAAHPLGVEKELLEYEEADYISIPSLFVKRSFLEQGVPEHKLLHNPYGVLLDEFVQIKKKDEIFRVVYVGGMTIRKGVHYLLQAFAELNLPNSELLLVGGLSDEMKPYFKKFEGNFKWIGHKPQKELHKYYSQGSVFVMMSVEEGLAMVQPQAMACGLPLICTTNTGGEDIIREGQEGFVIPIRDIEMLKKHLLYLYKNPITCREMGQAAKERVSKGFTWDDYGNRMIEMYENIIEVRKNSKASK